MAQDLEKIKLTSQSAQVTETQLNNNFTKINQDLQAAETVFRFETMPTASVDYVDKIVEYIGQTDETYTNGYFYKCVLDGSVYKWQQQNVQPDSVINLNGQDTRQASFYAPTTSGTSGQVLKSAGANASPTWVNVDGTATPNMDGIANVGTSSKFAREDHTHPTDTSRASQSDLTALTNRVSTAETNIQTNTSDIGTLENDLSNLTSRVTTAETDIDNVEGAINKSVLNSLSVTTHSGDTEPNPDNVTIDTTSINIKTGSVSSDSKSLPLADSDNAGLMSTTNFDLLQGLDSRVQALEGTTIRLLYTAKTNPTAAEINTFVTGLGYTAPFTGIAVIVDQTFHIWHYYVNESAWKDDGTDTVSTFTNTIAGTIIGKAEDGKVFAEGNGVGSVYGWDALKNRTATLEENSLTNVNYDTVNKKLTETKNNITTDIVTTAKLKSDMNLANVATSGSYNDLSDTPTTMKNPYSLTIQKNGTQVGDSYDGSAAKTINIGVPTALSDLTGDANHRLVTDTEKATWNNKQDLIDSQNKLESDLVDDTNQTNKFVTDSEKATWNAKQNAFVIESFTAADSRWGALQSGYYTLTIPSSKKPLICFNSAGEQILAGLKQDGTNIYVITDTKFAGTVLTI